jgi:hypothetical protein
MPSSIEIDVRDVLKTALSGISASVYSSPPEAVIPPACVIVPDAPYLETVTVGSGAIRVKINFVITAAVAYNNTAGALDGLEKLIISILTALPLGYVVGRRPTSDNPVSRCEQFAYCRFICLYLLHTNIRSKHGNNSHLCARHRIHH